MTKRLLDQTNSALGGLSDGGDDERNGTSTGNGQLRNDLAGSLTGDVAIEADQARCWRMELAELDFWLAQIVLGQARHVNPALGTAYYLHVLYILVSAKKDSIEKVPAALTFKTKLGNFHMHKKIAVEGLVLSIYFLGAKT